MSGKNATKTIVFDLETISDPSIIPHLPPIEADTRLKDPVKIQANIKMKSEKRIAELALRPTSAMICCFGYCFDDGDPKALMLTKADRETERKLLLQAWEILSHADQFVTFNGLGFDLPVLLMRSMMNKVRPAVKIDRRRYSVENHCDIRMVLGNWDSFAKGNLDFYSRVLLGKAGKDDIDGSMVGEMFEMELFDEISEYCQDDVKVTWELYQLLTKYYLL